MRKAKDDTIKHADVGNVETRDPDFPNLTRIRDQNRKMHVEQGVKMGMSTEEAERHADDDAKHWSPGHTEAKPHED